MPGFNCLFCISRLISSRSVDSCSSVICVKRLPYILTLPECGITRTISHESTIALHQKTCSSPRYTPPTAPLSPSEPPPAALFHCRRPRSGASCSHRQHLADILAYRKQKIGLRLPGVRCKILCWEYNATAVKTPDENKEETMPNKNENGARKPLGSVENGTALREAIW